MSGVTPVVNNSKDRQSLTSNEILRGLMDPKKSLQTRLSVEYRNHYRYYDEIARDLMKVKKTHERFDKYMSMVLRPWQKACLHLVMAQSEFQVVKVVTDG